MPRSENHATDVTTLKQNNVLYSALAAFFCDSVTIILTFIIIIIINNGHITYTMYYNDGMDAHQSCSS